jgi:glycosyltransferase involved in cell wall biosynthesis
MSLIKVSVIVPNYNHSTYLAKRLDSILDQSFKDFEIIILDDCSTDNSRDLILSYKERHSNINIIFNDKNSGSTFKQWNKGVNLAKGKYIWIAESDDYANVFFLEKLVPLMEENPDTGIAYCNSYIVDENNGIKGCMHDWKNKDFNTNRWSSSYKEIGNVEVENFLLFHCTINNASATLIRKEVFLRVGLDNERFKYVGDWYKYIHIALASNVIYISNCLNYYREHSNNASNTSINSGLRFIERYIVLSEIIGSLKNNKLEQQIIERLSLEFLTVLFKWKSNLTSSQQLSNVISSMYNIHHSLFFRVIYNTIKTKLKR